MATDFDTARAVLSNDRKPKGKKTVAPRGIPMDSSLLLSANWRDGQLFIKFDNENARGKLFVYRDVPESVFKRLIAAESQGGFFVRNIRDAYHYEVREKK
jgi:KTSC domain